MKKNQKNRKLYNSAYLIDYQGNLLINYRKNNLFDFDKYWSCSEGDGFKAVELVNIENKKFKARLAICMDINPYIKNSGLFVGRFLFGVENRCAFFSIKLTRWKPGKIRQDQSNRGD